MGANFSSADHDLLDKFLNLILDHYRDGMITHLSAHTALTQTISLVASADTQVIHHMQAFVNRDPRADL